MKIKRTEVAMTRCFVRESKMEFFLTARGRNDGSRRPRVGRVDADFEI